LVVHPGGGGVTGSGDEIPSSARCDTARGDFGGPFRIGAGGKALGGRLKCGPQLGAAGARFFSPPPIFSFTAYIGGLLENISNKPPKWALIRKNRSQLKNPCSSRPPIWAPILACLRKNSSRPRLGRCSEIAPPHESHRRRHSAASDSAVAAGTVTHRTAVARTPCWPRGPLLCRRFEAASRSLSATGAGSIR
jgi:hypothetical protein